MVGAHANQEQIYGNSLGIVYAAATRLFCGKSGSHPPLESEPEASVVASPTSVPAPPAVPSPTAKPGILKSIIKKVFGDSPTVEPAAAPDPTAAPDPVVAATVLGKSPVPDQTPESKPGVSASSDFSILTVDSSGSGLDHLAAAERYRVLSPPESAAITVDHDAATGYALVSAGEGAVPSNAVVLVANMELGNVAVVQADSKGAFATSIAARAGTHLLVKQDSTTEGYFFRIGIDEIVNS